MAYRFTNTDKWGDKWFNNLKPTAKLLFMYLCDSCTIAGIIELNERKFAFDLGADKQAIKAALKEIDEKLIYSTDERFVYILNFLKHQRNLPLNPENKAHIKIIRELEENTDKFGFQCIEEYFSKGDRSPINPPSPPPAPPLGIGKGKGKEEGKSNDSVIPVVVTEYDKVKEKYKGIDFSFVDQEFEAVYFDWLIYKQERHESYKTERSLIGLYTRLLNLSDRDPAVARKAIEFSIANNYQGFFKPKGDEGQRTQLTGGYDRYGSMDEAKESVIKFARNRDRAMGRIPDNGVADDPPRSG